MSASPSLTEEDVREFLRADRAALLAVTAWLDRNGGHLPDSDAEWALEQVAAFATYFYEAGIWDAQTANKTLDAVDSATVQLYTEYPTLEGRQGIDMQAAMREAQRLVDARQPPPLVRTNTPDHGKTKKEKRGWPHPYKFGECYSVCDELFGPDGEDRDAPAPTGTLYEAKFASIKARKRFREVAHLSTVEVSKEYMKSLTVFWLYSGLGVSLLATLGTAGLLATGGAALPTVAMGLKLAQGANTAWQLGNMVHQAVRRGNAFPSVQASLAGLANFGTTALSQLLLGNIGGKILYLRHRGSVQMAADAAASYNPLVTTVTDWVAKLKGLHPTWDKDKVLFNAMVNAKTVIGGSASEIANEDVKRITNLLGNGNDDGFRQALSKYLFTGTGAKVTGVVAGVAGILTMLGWYKYYLPAERKAAFLHANDPSDAEKWKRLIAADLKEVETKLKNRTFGTRARKARYTNMQNRLNSLLENRYIPDRDDGAAEYEQVSQFVDAMAELQKQVCQLHDELVPRASLPRRDAFGRVVNCNDITAVGSAVATGGGMWEWLNARPAQPLPPWGEGPPPDYGSGGASVPLPPQETAAEEKARLALEKAAAKERLTLERAKAKERLALEKAEAKENDALEKRRARARDRISSGYLKLTDKSDGRNKVGWPTGRAMNALSDGDRNMQDLVTRLALKINLAVFGGYGEGVDVLQLEDMIGKLQAVRIEARNFGYSITAAQKPDVLVKVKQDFDALGLPAVLDAVANQQYNAKTVLRIEEQQREDAENAWRAERAMRGPGRGRGRGRGRAAPAAGAGPVFGADEALAAINPGNRYHPYNAAYDAESVVDVVFGQLEHLKLE